ncbi:hypothetical protein [Psychromicrobium sp. YIM B11713]|uniref:hypothetical protein n=1 Tax=Psychromicrobium sp. YIM B11713 TaxID=3145233 RepID=UPI00374ECCF1
MVRASALGCWPGSDSLEAQRIILGELGSPHLPFLAQLPERGPGADRVGRSAALLTELPVDLQSFGWRFVQRPGADLRRAHSFLTSDLNVLADVVGAQDSAVPELKIQIMGPLSLAAGIHLPLGEKALIDYGARRDIADSLAAGISEHLKAVRAATPGARLTVQFDEPELLRVLHGTIRTVSGYRSIRAVSEHEVRTLWSIVMGAVRLAGASEIVLAGPADSLSELLVSEADGVAVPETGFGSAEWEALAAAVESGRQPWLGIDSIADPQLSTRHRAERLWRSWRTIGLPGEALSSLHLTEGRTLLTDSPGAARAVLGRLTDLSEALAELAQAE